MAKRWLARVREQKSVILRRSLIVLLSLMVVVGLWYRLPFIFPGGWGIGKDKSVTTESVESVGIDAQGNITKTVKTTKYDDGKTFWDWLSLLGVPLSLALLGVWFQWIQQKRAEDEIKEEVLQVYFDRLSVLLVDKNLFAIAAKVNATQTQEKEGQSKNEATIEERELLDSAVDVIRARTLSILRRFENDPEHKTSVIRFLIEAEIVSKFKLSLRGADLSGANLTGAKFNGAILSASKLIGADLIGADLSGADLIGAKLNDADLRLTFLRGAKLNGANLTDANLTCAYLNGAELCEANLNGANLTDVYLNGAYLTYAYLSGANLSGANLSGTIFGNNPDLSDAAKAEMIERGAIFLDRPESDVPSFVKR
jgi:uncharacterized protein YjbI with pentapeptide repeats